MARLVALAGSLVLVTACAGGAKPEEPAAAGVPAETSVAAAAEDRSAESVAVEALERGRALEKQGKRGDAADVYRGALRREDLAPKRRSELSLRMSLLLLQEGELENALEYARHAQHLRPDWDDAAAVAAKIEKKMHARREGGAASAKGPGSKGGGGVEDRLSRVEEQLAHVMKKLEGGTPSHAPEAKEKWAAAEKEMQGLREKIKRMHVEFETERDALRKRVHELEEECAALRRENAAR